MMENDLKMANKIYLITNKCDVTHQAITNGGNQPGIGINNHNFDFKMMLYAMATAMHAVVTFV